MKIHAFRFFIFTGNCFFSFHGLHTFSIIKPEFFRKLFFIIITGNKTHQKFIFYHFVGYKQLQKGFIQLLSNKMLVFIWTIQNILYI